MIIRVRNKKNLVAGLTFVAISIAFLVVASGYEMGSATRMGTGYFPTLLASLLLVIGVIVASTSLFIEGEEIGSANYRPLVFILGALVLFAGSLGSLGLIFATAILVSVSSLASWRFRIVEILGSVLFLTIFSYVVFAYGLEIPFKLWPWE